MRLKLLFPLWGGIVSVCNGSDEAASHIHGNDQIDSVTEVCFAGFYKIFCFVVC